VEGRLTGTCVNSDLWAEHMWLIVGVREEGMEHVSHHKQARAGTDGIEATDGTYTRRMHSDKKITPQSHACTQARAQAQERTQSLRQDAQTSCSSSWATAGRLVF
jgi:hypothetical protein